MSTLHRCIAKWKRVAAILDLEMLEGEVAIYDI